MQPFYDKDGITIYNGNCFDVFDDLKNNNFKTDLVLTDPPYGTTLLAAKKQKRRAVGIEMNLEYCEIAKKRLEECS